MLIKPYEIDSELFENYEGSVGNVGLADIKNELIIHDLDETTNCIINGINNSVGYATQTITTIEHNTPIENVSSIIERTYFYTIIMSPSISGKTFEERFRQSTLSLIAALSQGYACIEYENPYALQIYTLDNQVLSSIMNPSCVEQYKIGICDPTNIQTRIVNKHETDDSLIYNKIPKIYYGKDLADSGISLKHFEKRDSDIENDKLRQQISRMIPSLEDSVPDDVLWRSIELRMAIRNLMIDLIIPYYKSMFSEYIIVYRSGYQSGFKRLISPIDKLLTKITISEARNIRTKFIKLCDELSDRFNEPIDVKFYTTTHETICEVNLLKSNLKETKRMTNHELIHDCMVEIRQNPYDGINKFKQDMDLDRMSQYDHQHGDYKIKHIGNL